MKALPFTNPRWDVWNAFHIPVGHNFYQFDTGEVICTDANPHVTMRYHNTNINVQLWHSGQDPLPGYRIRIPTEPEGQDVPMSWLNRRGSQQLLIDHCTGHVVRLVRMRESQTLDIPSRFRDRVSAYFPGPGRPPVGGAVSLGRPISYTSEERARIAEKVLACRAWAGIHGRPDEVLPQHPTPAPLSVAWVLQTDLTAMTPTQMWVIGTQDLAPTYTEEKHPYLLCVPV